MRHSAFVCPAARINYDLLKWILLGALWCWLELLESHMHLSEQVYHLMDQCTSDDAWMFWKHTGPHHWWGNEARERPKDIWNCPILNVTQCARTVWCHLLADVYFTDVTTEYLYFPWLHIALPSQIWTFFRFTIIIKEAGLTPYVQVENGIYGNCGKLCSW